MGGGGVKPETTIFQLHFIFKRTSNKNIIPFNQYNQSELA